MLEHLLQTHQTPSRSCAATFAAMMMSTAFVFLVPDQTNRQTNKQTLDIITDAWNAGNLVLDSPGRGNNSPSRLSVLCALFMLHALCCRSLSWQVAV